MYKYLTILVAGMMFFSSGCSVSRYYDGTTPLELEQHENPMIWKEMLQVQASLWPLEKKVSKMEKSLNELGKDAQQLREELAAAKLASVQANQNLESIQAEIQQLKNESMRREKGPVELPVEKTNKKEMMKAGTTPSAEEGKKAGAVIPSVTMNDIQYQQVSDTQERVLIFLTAMSNPKRQILTGETPRIVLDFFNTRHIDREKFETRIDGNFIKRIRVISYKEPLQRVRVVFDMLPDKRYSLNQRFSKKENVYIFNITGSDR